MALLIHRTRPIAREYVSRVGEAWTLKLVEQLEIFGVEETRRRAAGEGATPAERHRLIRRVEVAHELLSELPSLDDLSFLHSGLCQTCLPIADQLATKRSGLARAAASALSSHPALWTSDRLTPGVANRRPKIRRACLSVCHTARKRV